MAMSPLRVCLDANVWVGFLLAESKGHADTVASRLVGFVTDVGRSEVPFQIVLTHELLDTLRRVLTRLGFAMATTEAFLASLVDLAATGPDRDGPSLLVSGRDQIAMDDREDAGILASCFAGRADLLVTDNLRDFQTNDADRLDTRSVRTRDQRRRQLFLLIHERQDGVALVIMHPVDALSWLSAGVRPTPGALRRTYGRPGSDPSD